MDKKYQIFISSTYIDLVDARSKVRDAILSMMHFPVGMEFFSAADEGQWEIIQDTIDSTDYYVLIVGKRYGTIIKTGNDAGISYTEKEYRYAKEKGIPILAFILSDTARIEKAFIETDPNKTQKLEEFKEDVKTSRMVDWWETSDELAQKVTIALHKEMDKRKRPGWVRNGSFDLKHSHEETFRWNGLVRELQEENAELKSKILTYVPKLMAKFSLYNSENKLVLELDEKHMKILHFAIDKEINRMFFLPLDRSRIDAYVDAYISDSDIKKYNSALPSKEEVDEYIERLDTYYRILEGGISLRFQVSNTGTVKAKDVSVSITFPDEIMVYKPTIVEEITEPVSPALPPDPIKKAREKFQEKFGTQPWETPYFKPIKSTDDEPSRSLAQIVSEIWDLTIAKPSYVSEGLSINEHAVFVNTSRISDEDSKEYVGIYLVPTKKGVFKATISLMCSEFPDAEEQCIDIEVV